MDTKRVAWWDDLTGTVEVCALSEFEAETRTLLLDMARREALAAGRTFDPADPEVIAWVDLHTVMALDDMGLLDPDEQPAG